MPAAQTVAFSTFAFNRKSRALYSAAAAGAFVKFVAAAVFLLL
jgi:hypothetical protein